MDKKKKEYSFMVKVMCGFELIGLILLIIGLIMVFYDPKGAGRTITIIGASTMVICDQKWYKKARSYDI